MLLSRWSSRLFVPLVVAACGDPEPVIAPPDFSARGPLAVDVAQSSLTTDDCSLAFTLFTPEGGGSAPLVVLGHGFSRSQNNMAALAEQLASFGVRVVTPQYCHASLSDVDHVANGRDAVALSSAVAGGAPVVHAGYSAGGLAAVLAASEDPAAVAVLGLDWVDADGLGVDAAAALSVPVLGLLGEPSMCNSDNNGAEIFEAPPRWAARVVGATHCDFEDPTDALCTAFCGEPTGALPVVRSVAAAFVAWQLDVAASGAAWASPDGEEWQRLVAEGWLDPL